jgi:subtilisin family serine protease
MDAHRIAYAIVAALIFSASPSGAGDVPETRIQRFLAQSLAEDALGKSAQSGIERREVGGEIVYSVYLVLGREQAADRIVSKSTALQLEQEATHLQNRALNAMDAELASRIVKRYRAFPILLAELNADQIERAAQNPFVADLVPKVGLEAQWMEAQALTGITTVAEGPEGLTGAGSVIAVIDNVFDAVHPSLGGAPFPNAKLSAGIDTGDGDADPTMALGSSCTSNGNLHGTYVAAIAAGNQVTVDLTDDGGVELRGAAPGAELVGIKLQAGLSTENTETPCTRPVNPSAGDIIDALDWIAMEKDELGIDIVTMSVALVTNNLYYGDDAQTCGDDWPHAEMGFAALADLGIMSFAAAGNNASSAIQVIAENKRRIAAPACLPSVISVSSTHAHAGAVDQPGCGVGIREYCDFEPATSVEADHVQAFAANAEYLDLMAPGLFQIQARSTHFDPENDPGPESIECSVGGTSFASPNAAGIAAMMIEKVGKGVFTQNTMRKLLSSTGCCVADINTDPIIVKPRVNALSASLRLDMDSDGDGLPDAVDNCIDAVNPDQRDSNADGYGNACDPDLDNSDEVNVVDLGLLRLAFFSNPASENWNADADFDGDGVVSFGDLAVMRAHFFGAPGPSAEHVEITPCEFADLGNNCPVTTSSCTNANSGS